MTLTRLYAGLKVLGEATKVQTARNLETKYTEQEVTAIKAALDYKIMVESEAKQTAKPKTSTDVDQTKVRQERNKKEPETK
jgi:hypothetical protein